jgi:ABC-type dipeptide/oligopeptide/nickel transport system ATPase subunit
MITVGNLQVAFGYGRHAVQAVRGVDLRIETGEVFGLVGESGSGKSTVLRALCGLITHWSGDIEIAGQRQGHRRTRDFYRLAQMVFQDPYASLHPRQTVDRALVEPLAIHGMGDVDRRIERVLVDVGLDSSFRYRYPHQLSGGQRQRVAIGRALILEPRLLLLDEPTSALDVSVQAEILNLLGRLRRERRMTYLLVSHNLAVVAHMCNRLAVMQRGRVVEELTTDQIRAAAPTHPYTQQLLRASLGYDRAAVDKFVEFD